MKLKKYNGGDWFHRGGHLYIGAYSVKDAVELINEAGKLVEHANCFLTAYYFNMYYHKGCWGTPMDGIEHERGVWWQKSNSFGHAEGRPIRLI